MKDTRIYCQLVVHPDCQKDDEGMISASIKLASICSCKIEKNIYLSILFFARTLMFRLYSLYSILTICKLGLPM